ncbi:MAG: prepilin-type N-terminal cleavage/methylation domain-containing protein [Porticoccaceae bacterium]|nr:prepilin-type N-terminal cleavage/methylation domain-containing protein [Porticoccaceae bacterium]
MVTPFNIRGFTLIELMIVILIIGLLALVTGPFTGAWSDGANIHKAQGELDQAVRYARAASLRNGAGAIGNEPAMRIIVDDSTVKVCKTVSGACGDVWWQTSLPGGVSVTGESEVLFDNKGLPINAATITLTRGTESHVYSIP